MRKEKQEQTPIDKELHEEPTRNTKRSGWDKLFDRMKRVDPEQSEKYKQRTGE